MVVAQAADPYGWCALGDSAWRDDGYLYLAVRLDGMVNTGSYHVYPRELAEATASTVPTVRRVLVRSEPDPTWVGPAPPGARQWRGAWSPAVSPQWP